MSPHIPRRASFGGFRVCLTSVLDESAAWDGVPRGGPMRGPARADFCQDLDAAGHPYERGEPESRAISIDSVSRRRRCDTDKIIEGLRSSGAAGATSPRLGGAEARALSIDHHEGRRRAYSEPPEKSIPTRGELQRSMHTFGVTPDIDSHLHLRRRSISPEFSPDTRVEISKRAVKFGDIDGLLKRKQWQGPAPGSLMSPRLRAQSLESIDIDTRYGRARIRQFEASTGIIPMSSPTYDLIPSACTSYPGSPRGWSSNMFFKYTLEAKKYAKLIGRPDTTKPYVPELTDANLEKRRKKMKEYEPDISRAVPDSPAASARSITISEISTTASSTVAALQAARQESSLSKAARTSLANVMKQEVGQIMVTCEEELGLHTPRQKEYESGMTAPKVPSVPKVNLGSLQRVQVPLHLHRVLSSITTERMNLPETMTDIKATLAPIFRQNRQSLSATSKDLLHGVRPDSLEAVARKVEALYFDQAQGA